LAMRSIERAIVRVLPVGWRCIGVRKLIRRNESVCRSIHNKDDG